MVHAFYHKLAKKFPALGPSLQRAQLEFTPAQFIRRVFLVSIYAALGMGLSLFFIISAFGKSLWILVPILPVFFIITFLSFLKQPDKQLLQKKKQIDRDILFVGKFFIVQIKSGIPIYTILQNAARDFDGVGQYFQKIIDDVDLGTSLDEAITKAIVLNPSENFQKVMWQIANSLQTGADIALSLTTVLEQINKMQLVEVERYGKKLNPIAMFYLMIAVIFPSLGMVILIVLVSFADIQLTLSALLGIGSFVIIVQLFFYTVIMSARPAVDM
ncbi:MAG: type II secretion system F family protein [Candidatus Woesearchaeota archaeon]